MVIKCAMYATLPMPVILRKKAAKRKAAPKTSAPKAVKKAAKKAVKKARSVISRVVEQVKETAAAVVPGGASSQPAPAASQTPMWEGDQGGNEM